MAQCICSGCAADPTWPGGCRAHRKLSAQCGWPVRRRGPHAHLQLCHWCLGCRLTQQHAQSTGVASSTPGVASTTGVPADTGCICESCPACFQWTQGRKPCGWTIGRKARDKYRKMCRVCSDFRDPECDQPQEALPPAWMAAAGSIPGPSSDTWLAQPPPPPPRPPPAGNPLADEAPHLDSDGQDAPPDEERPQGNSPADRDPLQRRNHNKIKEASCRAGSGISASGRPDAEETRHSRAEAADTAIPTTTRAASPPPRGRQPVAPTQCQIPAYYVMRGQIHAIPFKAQGAPPPHNGRPGGNEGASV